MQGIDATSYSTAEVATRIGVHRDTLLRWLRGGKISEPRRDRHGWRAFTEDEVQRIEQFAKLGPSEVTISGTSHGPPIGMKRLEALDWDFADAKTGYLTHRLHPYPAKFIPQIPNTLIQELSSVGEKVADIFCGSGTTLVEALTLKRNAVGIDANPLACLISRAKTAVLTQEERELLVSLASRADELPQSLVAEGQARLFPPVALSSQAPRPDSDAISFWFEPFIVEELADILSWCKALPTESTRNVALTAFSSVIVAVSKQDSDTRYVRRRKDLHSGDALRRFSRALADAVQAVWEFTELVESRFSCSVYNADVLSAPDIGPVDLVVCSPPYPNAYSYHLYHMTRMLWLGMNQPWFKKVEIGSHRKYSSKSSKRASIETFRKEMSQILGWLRRHLRAGRFACFVVGSSTIKGRKYNNTDVISEAAQAQGFREISRIDRRMQDTKKAFNPAIGKIKQEQILILQNGGQT